MVLPRFEAHSEKSERARNWGTLNHHWKETGDAAPAWADERDVVCLAKKLALSGIDRQKWWRGGDGEHEVTFALNLFSLRLVIFRGPRGKADTWKEAFGRKGRQWLTGTIDWQHWGSGDTIPWADDLKTGHWPVLAKKSRQLRSYALPAWVRAGCRLDYQCVVSVTQWEKYPLAGLPKRNAHRLSGLDLLEHLESLRYAVANPDEANVTENDPRTGELSECTFCKCREPFAASEWMGNYRYRTLPYCAAGIASRVERTDDGVN